MKKEIVYEVEHIKFFKACLSGARQALKNKNHVAFEYFIAEINKLLIFINNY